MKSSRRPLPLSPLRAASARLKAKPVFVDIDPRNLQPGCPALLEAAITSKTKAIMPVHLFGLAGRDGRNQRDRQATVAGDRRCRPVHRARYHEQYVGNIGSLGCFSFFPSKNLGGAGDGGMITTNDPELAERIAVLRDHGSRKKYHYDLIGMNSRLDSLQAAILLVKFKYLTSLTRPGDAMPTAIANLFNQAGWISDFPAGPTRGMHHVYNQFVIRSPEAR